MSEGHSSRRTKTQMMPAYCDVSAIGRRRTHLVDLATGVLAVDVVDERPGVGDDDLAEDDAEDGIWPDELGRRRSPLTDHAEDDRADGADKEPAAVSSFRRTATHRRH